jgi:hypothetical protein
MKPAMLPPELLAEPPRYIEQLKPGETGHVRFTEMVVNSNKECFLNTGAELLERNMHFNLEVRCDENGFHVATPPGFRFKYLPRELNRTGLLPVSSITVR